MNIKEKFRSSKWRIYFARIGAVVLIFINDVKLSKLGLIIILIGMLIRLWASGYLQKRRKLAMSGPYKFVRNPLYLGSIFIGLGFWVMSDNFLLFLPFFLVFAVMYGNTVKTEEKELLQKFGSDYELYLKDVPRFIPNFKNFNKPNLDKFSLENFMRNKEYMVAIGVVGVFLAMGIVHSVIYPFLSGNGNLVGLFKDYLEKILAL